GDGPAAVARFFLDYQVDQYEAIVGENLGADDERVTHWRDLQSLAGQRFAALNYLILKRWYRPPPAEIERNPSLGPGAPGRALGPPRRGAGGDDAARGALRGPRQAGRQAETRRHHLGRRRRPRQRGGRTGGAAAARRGHRRGARRRPGGAGARQPSAFRR